MRYPQYFSNLLEICQELKTSEQLLLPLCAAENVTSPFAQIPLDSFLQEKYIMGGVNDYQYSNNFVGSEKLFSIYELLQSQCKKLYDSEYADPRTLSGVNAVTALMMSLFSAGDKILLYEEDCGGHGSMAKICHRLGLKCLYVPFDYSNFDIDYEATNMIIDSEKISGILLCPSDIIKVPRLNRLNLRNAILIFDATQILGLIACNVIENPFDWFSAEDNFIMLGATHKTLPGPTCGLIMTKNKKLADQFDTKINPDYLRNVQMHHIVSLLLALMELEVFGKEYSSLIISNANILAEHLSVMDFSALSIGERFTDTHQIFLSMDKSHATPFMEKCGNYGISLNYRERKIYRPSGIRIGTQQVSRFGWGAEEMAQIAEVLYLIKANHISEDILKQKIINLTQKKTIKYTFDSSLYKIMYDCLHNC